MMAVDTSKAAQGRATIPGASSGTCTGAVEEQATPVVPAGGIHQTGGIGQGDKAAFYGAVQA